MLCTNRQHRFPRVTNGHVFLLLLPRYVPVSFSWCMLWHWQWLIGSLVLAALLGQLLSTLFDLDVFSSQR